MNGYFLNVNISPSIVTKTAIIPENMPKTHLINEVYILRVYDVKKNEEWVKLLRKYKYIS